MKEHSGEKPKLRVVDEESAVGEVVRLGGSEEILRLGDQGASPIDDSAPQLLEREEGRQIQARQANVEEILDKAADPEAPEDHLEEAWGGESKRWLALPWGWFVLIGLICVGFALWSLKHILDHRDQSRQITDRTVEMFAKERELDRMARDHYIRLERRISDYLASGTVEERLKHVRDPDRVAPLMDEYYGKNPMETEEFVSVDGLEMVTIGRSAFWMVRVTTREKDRVLLVQQTDDDDALVDWETDVCYQPIPWEQYVAERPEGRFDFRVKIRPDNYFGYEFKDESVYQAFRLTTRGSDEHLFGYVRRGSEEERRIMSELRFLGRPAPMILSLEFSKDPAAQRSVLISKVISGSWCLVDESS